MSMTMNKYSYGDEWVRLWQWMSMTMSISTTWMCVNMATNEYDYACIWLSLWMSMTMNEYEYDYKCVWLWLWMCMNMNVSLSISLTEGINKKMSKYKHEY